MINITTNKPNYNDVSNIKDEFRAWEHTYKYRGIEYDIKLLHQSRSWWIVVECPEGTRHISNLVDHLDIRADFIYHVCDYDESVEDMFYDAIDKAQNDINWFLDDAANDLTVRMKKDRALFSDIIDERRQLIGAY